MKGLYTLTAFLLICTLSCTKKDYDDTFTAFTSVYFVNKTALLGDLQVKFNGAPINWDISGRIDVPEGEAKFEFYDKKNGQVLAEKVVDVSKDHLENFIIFQPTTEAPLAFMDGSGQENEPAPPAGFIKIKVANYAPSLLPYEKTDLIIVGINGNFEFINLDTLTAITQNLGNEAFHLVPTTPDILGYSFYFKQHGTESIVKDAMGGNYINLDVAIIPSFMTPIPEKNIYTIYFTAVEPAVGVDSHIKIGDKYYNINPEILYVD